MTFKNLSYSEEMAARKYARENDPVMEDWGLYHPVCRKEWRSRGFCPEPIWYQIEGEPTYEFTQVSETGWRGEVRKV